MFHDISCYFMLFHYCFNHFYIKGCMGRKKCVKFGGKRRLRRCVVHQCQKTDAGPSFVPVKIGNYFISFNHNLPIVKVERQWMESANIVNEYG